MYGHRGSNKFALSQDLHPSVGLFSPTIMRVALPSNTTPIIVQYFPLDDIYANVPWLNCEARCKALLYWFSKERKDFLWSRALMYADHSTGKGLARLKLTTSGLSIHYDLISVLEGRSLMAGSFPVGVKVWLLQGFGWKYYLRITAAKTPTTTTRGSCISIGEACC